MDHHDPASAHAAFWRAATRRLTRQINAGWWLSGWLPLAAVIGLAGMVAVLYARWRAADAAVWVWGCIAAAFVAAGVAAWWRGRGRFESEASARVRLEESLGLQARLTAASAGVGAWPARPSPTDHRWPVMWQWRQPAAAVSFIGAMLALATWVPIAEAVATRKHVIEKPTDARMVEQWVDELRREEIINEPSADEVQRAIKELTERPAEEWYEHATLEAAGTLKEQTASQMREMAENVAAAERAAAALQSMQESLPAPLRESLAKDLASALKALELGGFKPAGDLAKLLREVAPADLGQLTPEQRAALAKRLAANRKALLAALAKCKGFNLSDVEGWCEECSGCKPCGECKGCKDGKACRKTCSKCGRPGLRPGRGGINRGRGDAEMSFGERNDLGTTRTEKVQQEIDAQRAAPEDVLAVVDGEHDVDESAYTGPQAGGGIASEGDGGAAVQVDSLLPAEQSAVRRFFE
ncbi:MAG: hypothetical protein WCC69_14565 [Pirellulales bacterium]